MTFDCRDLERALESDDEALRKALWQHARQCADCRGELDLSDALSAAARAMHREWDSPHLWPATAARMRAIAPPRALWTAPVWRLAAAAVLVLAVASVTWVAWRSAGPAQEPARADLTRERLLSERALSDIERAEAEYIRAIETLAKTAAPRIETPASPLMATLRERLLVIDNAIAECRAELERNRFNAHLRRQLLDIYREKRRTLEQILEQEHAL